MGTVLTGVNNQAPSTTRVAPCDFRPSKQTCHLYTGKRRQRMMEGVGDSRSQ
jgi:hypothetical protein